MTTPTLHDQIITLLTETLDAAEAGEIHLPLLAPVARPVLARIRREQSYDPEVLALLDRVEALIAERER
ncbi:hypothetical protein NOR51B_2537 [Luminiphilus syltensis NOR5-1B]|uniref:Uncharacterized protein n=1 Tax=Luminiphilus syltensis NOR5-1B TaxID=565045 RepID=B8KVR5_9GAMM|nr:hypothetical protein [Luminiphilus syltensis]EED36585.1 hypothetical protein NOR51B_2537 [Luminiphilus syltensis NOR5-1B]